MSSEKKKTILLVEDEIITAIAEKMTLEKYGYVVITVNTGEQAVELFTKDNVIDLILMDIDLGAGIDGTQAAEIILKDRDIPVVFLSSHTEPEVVEKTEKITSYGYVVKSSSITVLDASIKMAFKLFEANQYIHDSEEKYRLAFFTSPNSININSMDGLYLDINEGFTKLTGYTRQDVIGVLSSDIKIWHIPEDRDKLIEGLTKMARLITWNRFFDVRMVPLKTL